MKFLSTVLCFSFFFYNSKTTSNSFERQVYEINVRWADGETSWGYIKCVGESACYMILQGSNDYVVKQNVRLGGAFPTMTIDGSNVVFLENPGKIQDYATDHFTLRYSEDAFRGSSITNKYKSGTVTVVWIGIDRENYIRRKIGH